MPVISTNSRKELSVVLFDERLRDKIKPDRDIKVYTSLRKPDLLDQKQLFVISQATKLMQISGFIREANQKNHLKALFIRPDIDKELLLQLMDFANLRSLRRTLIYDDPQIPIRVLNAWKQNAQDQLIAAASVKEDTLFVVSCALKFFVVQFEEIPALAGIPAVQRNRMVIAPDGRYIHWEAGDIHLNIEMIRYQTDERFRAQADLERIAYQENVGAILKEIRQAHGLRQSDF